MTECRYQRLVVRNASLMERQGGVTLEWKGIWSPFGSDVEDLYTTTSLDT